MIKMGCIEEVAYNMEFICSNQLQTLGQKYIKSRYGEYPLSLID